MFQNIINLTMSLSCFINFNNPKHIWNAFQSLQRMPLPSYPRKVTYSSEANTSRDPVLPGPGLSLSLISCPHSPDTPHTHIHSPLVARFPTSGHLLTHAASYACNALLSQQWSPLKTLVCHLVTPLLEDLTDTSRWVFHDLLVFPLYSVGTFPIKLITLYTC